MIVCAMQRIAALALVCDLIPSEGCGTVRVAVLVIQGVCASVHLLDMSLILLG